MSITYDLTKVDQNQIVVNEETYPKNIDVRYSLTIPFIDRREGLSVGIILMNPSKAYASKSDKTINKLIDFLYSYQIDDHLVKDITICNILPIYATNTEYAREIIKKLNSANYLDRIEEKNKAELSVKMESKSLIVLAWGKPKVKTIPNLYYYKEVLSIVDVLSAIHKDNLYIFDIEDAISEFTEHGDPRHAGRSGIIKNLREVRIPDLFGLQ